MKHLIYLAFALLLLGCEKEDANDGTVRSPQAGSLSEVLADYDKNELIDLKLSGHVNYNDLKMLSNEYRVRSLDLSVVTIVECIMAGTNRVAQENVIGDTLFWKNQYLEKIVLPNSVTSIGRFAFSGCTGLTSISIPNSVTSIGGLAFHGCSGLTSITIGESVVSIGGGTFLGCSGLASIYLKSKTPPDITADTFIGFPTSRCTLYVPRGSKSAYSSSWTGFKDIIEWDF
jgi:hypothetical protein